MTRPAGRLVQRPVRLRAGDARLAALHLAIFGSRVRAPARVISYGIGCELLATGSVSARRAVFRASRACAANAAAGRQPRSAFRNASRKRPLTSKDAAIIDDPDM